MSEIDPATAGTRIAVELLTSWMEQDQQSAAERIERVLDDPNGPGARTDRWPHGGPTVVSLSKGAGQ